MMRSLVPLTIGASLSVVALLFYLFRKKSPVEREDSYKASEKVNGSVVKGGQEEDVPPNQGQQVPLNTEEDIIPANDVTVTTEEVSVTTIEVPTTTEEPLATTEPVSETTEKVLETTAEVVATTQKVPATPEQVPATTPEVPTTTEPVTETTEQVLESKSEARACTEEMPCKAKEDSSKDMSVETVKSTLEFEVKSEKTFLEVDTQQVGKFATELQESVDSLKQSDGEASDSAKVDTVKSSESESPNGNTSDSEQCSEKSEISLPEADQCSHKSEHSLAEADQRRSESSQSSPKIEVERCVSGASVGESPSELPNGEANRVNNLEVENVIECSNQSSNSQEAGVSIIQNVKSESNSCSVSSNPESNVKTTELPSDKIDSNNIENLNDQVKQNGPIQRYYENHYYPLLEDNANGSTKYDYRQQWYQAEDGKVFVEAVEGQPLVPNHLRDPKYLSSRTISSHSTKISAHLQFTLPRLIHAPLLWVRVISVSDDLELRVRQDQRDMLLQEAETSPLCNPHGPSPTAKSIKVGSLVAAELAHPKLGKRWFRVRVNHIKELQQGNASHKVPRYVVESIDHYSEMPEPVLLPLNSIRSLNQHGHSMPFYDQLVYIKNFMPKNKQTHPPEARKRLLRALQENSNFLYLSTPTPVCVGGAMYWIADPVYCTGAQNVAVGAMLAGAGLGMHVFHGLVTPDTRFDNCCFIAGEAYWANDRRKPDPKAALGDTQGLQYVFVIQQTHPGGHTAFGGFELPYKHAVGGFRLRGFNMAVSELLTLYAKQHKYDKNLRTQLEQIRCSPALKLPLALAYETLMAFYISDVEQTNNPECLVAFGSNRVVPSAARRPIAFPKDQNGFLYMDTQTGVCRKMAELRHPVDV